MNRLLYNKLQRLKKKLKEHRGVVVAFSGGVDSSLLLKVAKEVLSENVIAVTARSETYSSAEFAQAKKIAKMLRCKHLSIRTAELKNKKFRNNSINRCYHCKLELFKQLKKIASRYGYDVIEASNRSDLKDFRPGLKATKRLNIKSPLIEVGLKKEEIRSLAKKFNLPNWNKPSMACLASRIPFGTKINRENLKRIESAEFFLKKYGFIQIRVRDHFPIARIEMHKSDFKKILVHHDKIVRYFKKLGYKYVTLDLEGYRSGSLNP